MTATRTAYVNARLLDPIRDLDAPGGVLVEDGLITEAKAGLFAGGAPDGVDVIDCGGHCLAPALIDARVHIREPGYEHQETLETTGQAAAVGGVGTIVALPNTDPVIDEPSVLQFVQRRAVETGLVRFHCHAAITRGAEGKRLTEMGLLAEAGAVSFTDGTAVVAETIMMRRALSYAKGFGMVVIQRPEDPSLASCGVMNEGEVATRLGLAGIPAAAETIMLERDLRLAELTGGRYHAGLVSTAASIDAIRQAKARGLEVTCDTAPHYFALSETAVDEYRTFAKVAPPLRSEADRKAVIAGLSDGTIDMVVSDHAPSDQDSKRLPFAQAEPGVVGLETLLPLMLEPHHNGDLGLLDALAKVTLAPSEILGIPGGCLTPREPADLVLFDPGRPWRIDTEEFHSKSRNSPFDGRPVQGRVLRTVVGGKPVFEAQTSEASG